MRPLLAALLLLTACTFDTSGTALPPDEGGDDAPTDDPTAPDAAAEDPVVDEPDATPPPTIVVCTVNEEHLGIPGLIVKVSSRYITFESWMAKSGAPGAYAGFELSDDAEGRRYDVTSGDDTFRGEGTTWIHPEGLDEGSPVRRVEFCDLGGSGPGSDDD